jgi:hypothetical protein
MCQKFGDGGTGCGGGPFRRRLPSRGLRDGGAGCGGGPFRCRPRWCGFGGGGAGCSGGGPLLLDRLVLGMETAQCMHNWNRYKYYKIGTWACMQGECRRREKSYETGSNAPAGIDTPRWMTPGHPNLKATTVRLAIPLNSSLANS